MLEKLLPLYENEMKALEHDMTLLAQQHPESMATLKFDNSNSASLVTQLIQSIAFISARTQAQFDDSQNKIMHSLLRLLTPHLEYPTPSYSIIQFKPRKSADHSLEIPRLTRLIVQNERHEAYEFRTAYATQIQNIELTEIKLAKHSLKLELQAYTDYPKELNLRFYLNGHLEDSLAIKNLIFTQLNDIDLEVGSSLYKISSDQLKILGLEDNENLLDHPKTVLKIHRTLQEFLNYPHKFLFFEIKIPPFNIHKDLCFSLIFNFNTEISQLAKLIHQESFKLNCCPIINLYSQLAEPIKIDPSRKHYELLINQSASTQQHMYRITQIQGITEAGISTNYFPVFYNDFKQNAKEINCWELDRQENGTLLLKIEQAINNNDKFLSCELLVCDNIVAKSLSNTESKILFKDKHYPHIEKPEFILEPTLFSESKLNNNLLNSITQQLKIHYQAHRQEFSLEYLLSLLRFYNSKKYSAINQLINAIKELNTTYGWHMENNGSLAKIKTLTLTINKSAESYYYLLYKIIELIAHDYSDILCKTELKIQIE